MRNLPSGSTNFAKLLRKAVVSVATLALFVLILMFSALLLAFVLTAGAIGWAYLWWRTRDLRRQMRQHPSGDAAFGGEVIDGEAIRVVDPAERR